MRSLQSESQRSAFAPRINEGDGGTLFEGLGSYCRRSEPFTGYPFRPIPPQKDECCSEARSVNSFNSFVRLPREDEDRFHGGLIVCLHQPR